MFAGGPQEDGSSEWRTRSSLCVGGAGRMVAEGSGGWVPRSTAESATPSIPLMHCFAMKRYDVLVVGAGPAGSRVAHKLAESGHSVAVFEKQREIGDHVCCTGIIGAECMTLFDIDKSCVLREARSASLFAPSGQSLRVSKDEVQAHIVDRPAFNRLLVERARRQGADYFTDSYVSDIAASHDGVEVRVDKGGGSQTFAGKVAVIANGFVSKLPQMVGLGRINAFIPGAQVEVETCSVEEVEIYFSQRLAPHFFAWLVPISSHRARVGLFAPHHPGAHLKAFLAHLAEKGKVAKGIPVVSYGAIPLKPLSRTYGRRVLVVGDAAGQVKPTTGGGIYYGLLCADIASATLHQALAAGDFSGQALAPYEKLWKRKLARELRIDYFARRLYNRLSDSQIDSIFNIVREHGIHQSLVNSSRGSFDWHGELVIEGMKHLSPWWNMFTRYVPAYIWKSLGAKLRGG